MVRGNKSNPLNTTELAWLKKCTPDYLKLSEVSTIRTFSSRKWTGLVLVFQLWAGYCLLEVSTIRTFSNRKWTGFVLSSRLCSASSSHFGLGGQLFCGNISARRGAKVISLYSHSQVSRKYAKLLSYGIM